MDVYLLDYPNNLWHTFALPRQKLENCLAAVHLGGEIYFIGSSKEVQHKERRLIRPEPGKPLDIAAIHNFQFARSSGYFIGGDRIYYETVHIYRNTIYKLAADFTWKELSSNGCGRYGISKSCVAYKNCVWIIGGMDMSTNSGTNTVEEYDPMTDSWTQMP